MCRFKEFFYLCGCSKYKVAIACANASADVQGKLFCKDDPHPHPEDGVYRGDMSITHGPGVCSGVACRWYWGVHAPGDFGPKHGGLGGQDYDAEFDISEEACMEREDRWYRMLLTTDQQFECLSTNFPVPLEQMSDYAQSYLNPHAGAEALDFERAATASSDQLRWQELNPRYFTTLQLQHATGKLLPATVTAPGQESGSTPHKPSEGPFKVPVHACKPKLGICRRCGRNHGKMKAPVVVVEEPSVRMHKNLGIAVDRYVMQSAVSESYRSEPMTMNGTQFKEEHVDSSIIVCDAEATDSRADVTDVTDHMEID